MLTRLRTAAVILLALAAGSLRADGPSEHLFAGNPSRAKADRERPDDYLLKKPQYALSYNEGKGTANWASWHIGKKWLGTSRRGNQFAPDLTLPAGFLAVRPNDYRASGFDRGHLCPAADRSASKEDIDATFLMTNMVPQAPDLNRGPWEMLEEYCRDQARQRDKDLYVVAGPVGRGGVGSEGRKDALRSGRGRVVVPARCWKVVLAVPAGAADPRKVTAEDARVFAVAMPNEQGLDPDWRSHAVKVSEVEALTGLSFFKALPAAVADDLRSREPETRDRAARAETPKKATPRKKADDAGGELAAWEEGCVVGNRASKVYHLPGGRHYKTGKTSKNAVFFRSEEDAKKAGYRASKN